METVFTGIFSSLIFLFSFLYSKKNHYLTRTLYILYSITFFLSVILYFIGGGSTTKILPTLYLLVCLFLWISPFFSSEFPIYFSDRKAKRFSLFWGTLSSVFTVYFAIYAFQGVRSNPLEYARQLLNEESVLPLNMVTYVGLMVQSIYYVNIIFFFIGVLKKYSKPVMLLLFIGSLCNVFYVLCYFGRDGILFWVLNYLIIYVMVRNKIDLKTRRKIITTILIVGLPVIVIFAVITIVRFGVNGSSSKDGALYSLIDYGGQQLSNFTDSFRYDMRKGSLFPKVLDGLGKVGIKIETKEIYYGNTSGLYQEVGVFGYFIKSFTLIIGKARTLLLSICISPIIFFLSRKKNIGYKIMSYTLFQIPLYGIFYYRQAVSYMDYSYVLSVLIAVYFLFTLNINRKN